MPLPSNMERNLSCKLSIVSIGGLKAMSLRLNSQSEIGKKILKEYAELGVLSALKNKLSILSESFKHKVLNY